MNRAAKTGEKTKMHSTETKTTRRLARLAMLACLAALAAAALGASGAQAAPVADVHATWGDTNLTPGGEGQFVVVVRNVGDEDFSAGLTITEELPEGVIAKKIIWGPNTIFELCEEFGWPICEFFFGVSPVCTGVGTETVSCELHEFDVLGFFGPPQGKAPGLEDSGFINAEPTGHLKPILINVEVDPEAPGTGTSTATVTGGGSAPASDVDPVSFDPTPSAFGIVPGSFGADVFTDAYPFGSPSRQAGDHPYELRVNFDFNAATRLGGLDGTREVRSNGSIRTVEATLPRGYIGNPEALPKCDPVDFAELGAVLDSTGCPANTQLGYLNIPFIQGEHDYGQGSLLSNTYENLTRVAFYNLEPPRGKAADIGFNAGGLVLGHIYPILDPAQDYAIKTVSPNISALVNVRGAETTFWGVPGDPTHDKFRYFASDAEEEPPGNALGARFGAQIRPFLTNPMDCGFDNGGTRIRIDSYEHADQFSPIEEYPDPLNVEGCNDARFRFEPDISLQPTSRDAGGPTGLDVHLEVPQRSDVVSDAEELYAENGFVKGISTPPIKRVVTTFPEGMTLSPSAAQGLGSCTPAQIGLGTNDPVTCPDSSQFGRLIMHTPILPIDEQPEGFIYIAKQGDNPNHNFLSIYLVVQEPNKGILVKIPGRVDLDPVTGQISTTFDDLPQFPVDDMQLSFKGGVRAGLVNPTTCGTKTITAEFFTWQDPGTPHPVESSYEITNKADGSPCVTDLAQRPFAPTLDAGTLNNRAGSYSPFVFRLTRTDDDQEFSQLGIEMPEGLSAKIAGVSECSEAGIAQAGTPGRTGTEEINSPSCPDSSLIGTTNVGSGVGVPLTYVPGKAYLAGPYAGAPLSMVAITPVITGPFDLGVVSVRAALHIDPETAEVSVATDPFPQIFQGIPVRLRDIRVRADRPEFTINPTSCAEKQITAHLTGTGGDVNSTADDTTADLATRFQAAECASLGFGPKLHMRLFGGTKRGAHPKFRSVLTMPTAGANIDRAAVALPRSEFLDQGHIRTVCTRVQFAADRCPEASIYGRAVANTPLLDKPLKGPIYLRSSNHKLPDLVAKLRGKIAFNLVGRIDSVRGGIRSTFDLVPDAPVSKFVLTLQGGRKGLLINSRDLCRSTARATANFGAQNGRSKLLRPKMRNACGKKKSKRARRAALLSARSAG